MRIRALLTIVTVHLYREVLQPGAIPKADGVRATAIASVRTLTFLHTCYIWEESAGRFGGSAVVRVFVRPSCSYTAQVLGPGYFIHAMYSAYTAVCTLE